MFSKTDYARALVQKFPKAATDLLLRVCPDNNTLEQELLKECEHISANIHTIISEARHHRVAIYQPPSNDSALGSSLNSLGGPGLDLPIPRAPKRSSLSGQSGISSHHETSPSPEFITAVVARMGEQKEYPLSMKRSRISSDYSFITKEKAKQLKLVTTPCNVPLPTPWPGAHVDLRATRKCQLTWLRSTSDKTHDTTCLVIPSTYLEADLELGHKDYGKCAQEDNASEDSSVEDEEAGIEFHNPQSKFHEPHELSFHRSAISTSDNQTIKQIIPAPSFNQGQGHKHGEGHTHNLVDDVIRRPSMRKGSLTPSQIPRPSASPIRTTGSPAPSQPRTQATPAPSTSSKLSQNTQPLKKVVVEYVWGAPGDEISSSGSLDLNASALDFLESLQETCQDSLELELKRDVHCIHFKPDLEKLKRWNLNLHDDAALQDDWDNTIKWIQKNKSGNKPHLYVVIIEKRRIQMT